MEDDNTIMSFIEENLICPVNLTLLKLPITTSQGCTYELHTYLMLLTTNSICPITREKLMSQPLTKVNNLMKNLITEVIKKKPELKKAQIKVDYSTIHFIEKCHDYIDYYDTIPNDKITCEFLVSKLKDISCNTFSKKLIDKIETCYEYSIDNLMITILKLMCENKIHNVEIMKYIINKTDDLEYETNEGNRPIHLICKYSTPEMIKYIIDKGVNLECENNKGEKPIHLICKYSMPEMIKYIIDK